MEVVCFWHRGKSVNLSLHSLESELGHRHIFYADNRTSTESPEAVPIALGVIKHILLLRITYLVPGHSYLFLYAIMLMTRVVSVLCKCILYLTQGHVYNI